MPTSYYGLTETVGPFRPTNSDRKHLGQIQVPFIGGGVPAGGTSHAGHANWLQVMNPVQSYSAPMKGFSKPSPYASPSVVVAREKDLEAQLSGHQRQTFYTEGILGQKGRGMGGGPMGGGPMGGQPMMRPSQPELPVTLPSQIPPTTGPPGGGIVQPMPDLVMASPTLTTTDMQTDMQTDTPESEFNNRVDAATQAANEARDAEQNVTFDQLRQNPLTNQESQTEGPVIDSNEAQRIHDELKEQYRQEAIQLLQNQAALAEQERLGRMTNRGTQFPEPKPDTTQNQIAKWPFPNTIDPTTQNQPAMEWINNHMDELNIADKKQREDMKKWAMMYWRKVWFDQLNRDVNASYARSTRPGKKQMATPDIVNNRPDSADRASFMREQPDAQPGAGEDERPRRKTAPKPTPTSEPEPAAPKPKPKPKPKPPAPESSEPGPSQPRRSSRSGASKKEVTALPEPYLPGVMELKRLEKSDKKLATRLKRTMDRITGKGVTPSERNTAIRAYLRLAPKVAEAFPELGNKMTSEPSRKAKPSRKGKERA